MKRGFNAAFAFVFPFAAAGVVYACANAPSNARIGIDAPDRSQFDPVGQFLNHRCGSLDCHGNPQRNLIIYGCEGLRLDPTTTPGCRGSLSGNGTSTTSSELDATYRSLVGLEPLVMSDVVANHGANPDELTFIRKARGLEQHKGGQLVVPGDPRDVCMTSWLAGTTDENACTEAICYDTPATIDDASVCLPQDAGTTGDGGP